MSKFHDLLARVADESVRSALKAEYEHATKHKKFGLVFEEHLPEVSRQSSRWIRRRSPMTRFRTIRSWQGFYICERPLRHGDAA